MKTRFSVFYLFSVLIYYGWCMEQSIDYNIMHLAYKDEIQVHFQLKSSKKIYPLMNESPQIKFHLFLKDLDLFEVLTINDPDSVQKSHFNKSIPTKVLIHGWMDSASGNMETIVKHGFFKQSEDVNVLGVDWSRLSINLNYMEAAKKTELVGKEVARMLDFLVGQGARLEDFHLIGHSLGAHVAGSAGRSLTSGRLPRITGLDPALPGFEVVHVAKKLGKTDANFVDCIHTCGGFLGLLEPLCHVDFYPNGGVYDQPGCSFLDFGKCSHFRSFEYFAESINREHKFPALYCGPTLSLAWKCQNSSELMGYPVNTPVNGIYFVKTGSKYPFAPQLS